MKESTFKTVKVAFSGAREAQLLSVTSDLLFFLLLADFQCVESVWMRVMGCSISHFT